ncbi:hypothetical protein V5O48_009224 [Marasmius crinis-equi]|uniref:UBA domain-containing protein n=1 Tax=Marasmius crinis-equi TaxID=585013 RepID=A0ABR3FBV9_9AGAR
MELHVHDERNGDLFWGTNTLGWVSRDKYYYQSSYTTNPHRPKSHQTPSFGQQHSDTSDSAGGQGPKIVHHYRGRHGNEYRGDTAIERFSEDVHYIPAQDIAVRPVGRTPHEPGAAEARRRKLFEAPTFESVLQAFEDLGFLRAEAKQAMSDCGNDPGHVLEVLMARRKAARSLAQ